MTLPKKFCTRCGEELKTEWVPAGHDANDGRALYYIVRRCPNSNWFNFFLHDWNWAGTIFHPDGSIARARYSQEGKLVDYD